MFSDPRSFIFTLFNIIEISDLKIYNNSQSKFTKATRNTDFFVEAFKIKFMFVTMANDC